jgi:hypothetical protein
MYNKRLLIAVCVLVLALSTFTFTRRAQTNLSPQPRRAVPGQGVKERVVPDHVAYEFLFRSNAHFRRMAAEAGKPQALNQAFLKDAGLDEPKARVLDEIAATTLQEVDRQDERARAIIEAFRARYPGGVVPRGEPLPPPPPELKAMQAKRNAMFLRGRGRVLAALGRQEFDRFDGFVKKRFAGTSVTITEPQQ